MKHDKLQALYTKIIKLMRPVTKKEQERIIAALLGRTAGCG